MIAIVIFLCLLILYLGYERWHTHETIRWWQFQQSRESYQASEYIRDHLVQKLFAFRRELELSTLPDAKSPVQPAFSPPLSAPLKEVLPQPEDSVDRVLEILQQCQQDLANLSDRLSSLYGAANLFLALQTFVEQWQSTSPCLDLTLNLTGGEPLEASLPADLQPDRPQNYQVILNWLSLLFAIILRSSATAKVSLDLAIAAQQTRLQIQIQGLEPSFLETQIQNLRSLRRMFILLTKGTCCYRRQSRSSSTGLTCVITWDPRLQCTQSSSHAFSP